MAMNDHTALVTAAHSGHGPALVAELLRRGVRKVYVAATETVSLHGLLKGADRRLAPLPLDVTDPYQVDAAARVARDTTLLVNNASFADCAPTLHSPDNEHARREMDVNYFGLMAMMRAFVPVLPGGTVVNLLLAPSVDGAPPTFAASKAAALVLTRSFRDMLAAQQTRVVSVLLTGAPCTPLMDAGASAVAMAVETIDAVERGVNADLHMAARLRSGRAGF